MKINSRFFAESLVVRLGIALGSIVALALTAIISATVFSELSTGKATAINLAGSLRMQSYWITVQVQRGADGVAHPDLARAITEFESRLTSPLLTAGLPSEGGHPTRVAYEKVAGAWFSRLRPSVANAVRGDTEARDRFVASMASFVREVDQLVWMLEQDLERRIQTLRLVQGVALFAIVLVIFLALYLLHAQVIVPLADLLGAARRVRGGDFTVRARHAGEDELGQLGQGFNTMVADLSANYAMLEARVREKTEQLARSNVSLEVLYNTTRTLAESPLTPAGLETVMSDIERVVGLQAGVICAREENDAKGFPIPLSMATGAADAWCAQERCRECLGECESGVRAVGAGADRLLSVPLSEGGRPYGVMLLRFPEGKALEDWKIKLLESVGHHIGAALAAAKRSDERRRIALLEERSVIARELHDSLAQSLSYLKIQVTRLKSQLDAGAARERNAEVVGELKAGLNNAYRQLRELLTTFRLRMDGRGLRETLQSTIDEFAMRSGVEVRLGDRLAGHELDANEQIHVLQVVREALANVEHHSRARHADVHLAVEGGEVRVTVDDDGVGIGEGGSPARHYGLAIMRDRAATLGGSLLVGRRAEGGTRVQLRFIPRGPFQLTAAPAARVA